MNIGKDLIRKCYHCNALFGELYLNSGNTIGAIYYTDGKCYAPMLPSIPRLVVCPHCNGFVWRDRAEVIEDVIDTQPRHKELTEHDWLTVSESEESNGEQLLYVRMQAWHSSNDAVRNDSRHDPAMSHQSPQQQENMRLLIKLLTEDTNDSKLMKAEIYRELGEFDESDKILSADFPSGYSEAVDTFRLLNKKRLVAVSRFK